MVEFKLFGNHIKEAKIGEKFAFRNEQFGNTVFELLSIISYNEEQNSDEYYVLRNFDTNEIINFVNLFGSAFVYSLIEYCPHCGSRK